ncbi:transglutaminase-like domain-containing protein [Janibacter hoylei]|uniref:Transglutaminase n=1 Tax=Janibacter hoylei PVAS-1 TaxID=1210046 RepID=K1E172_9MICO|nr:transglutaminase family protein [Janibacter hoylei]EKA62454.1 transglutaminase [Janibacter hoylei PVAS-1]MCT1618263.1 transglutaminase family protein [Janibacter hoylei]MCT2293702.1 transglutaminase family protein [Janibacter hoylei]MCW4601452.1 transglutaminase family protein [Janibacter hoylei]RWU83059.1 transglutaminase family protein [Janibacter hoylei PVAS-1]
MTDLAIVDAAATPLQARVGTKFAYSTTGVREALLSFAVSNAHDILEEEILIHAGGREVQARELAGNHGTRLHLVEGVGDGWLEVTYSALVDITRPTGDQVGREIDFDRWVFTRPSRYAESDRLAPMAARLFPTQTGVERVEAVGEWVNTHMAYISGSSRGTDGAVDSILQASGVCRDFAHVVVALLRALGTPARLVSVYAPGLQPMDFHAVAEAWVDDAWHIVDATRLAPRESMIRIATGRDAADTAFLTTRGGRMTFNRQVVTATLTEGTLPQEDPSALVRLP